MSDEPKRWRSELTEADAKTLRLSTPPLSREKVDQGVRFQRAWLSAASSGVGDESRWRETALQASGLTALELPSLEAVVRAFAGSRWTRQQLERKRLKTQSLPRLTAELVRDRDLESLKRRYGADAVEVLSEREAELVALHEEIQRLIRNASAT